MGLPPEPAAQEAPLQELTARDRQPVQATPFEHDRDGVRAGRLDRVDPQAVIEGPPQRETDAARDDERECPDPQRGPPRRRPPMADERRTGVDLMRERQEQREVRVQVHRPPGLVGHPPTGEPVGRHPGRHQQHEPDGRRQDPGIGPQELAELVQETVVSGLGVTDGDQHAMGDEEVQRPRSELAMPAHEPVLTDRALERRAPRDEHDHDHHRVGGAQPGEPAKRGGETAGGAQRARALGRDAERERGAEAEPGDAGEQIDDQRARARRNPPAHADHMAWDRRRRADRRSRRAGGHHGGRTCRHRRGRLVRRRSAAAPPWLLGTPARPQRARAHSPSSSSGKPGVDKTVPSARIVSDS